MNNQHKHKQQNKYEEERLSDEEDWFKIDEDDDVEFREFS